MRLVVDTNVFVSAALKEVSWPAKTIRWVSRHGGLLKSRETEHEVLAILQRPRFAAKMSPLFIDEVRHLFSTAALISINERVAACRDPDDDKFLEVAVNGQADVIVSGDNDLLALHEFRRIPIITPAAFAQAQVRRLGRP